jgi:hypothetical protein
LGEGERALTTSGFWGGKEEEEEDEDGDEDERFTALVQCHGEMMALCPE